MSGHFSRPTITRRLWQPTRTSSRDEPPRADRALRPDRTAPCLVLLPAGFTEPIGHPIRWCALTAPFHPYLATRWQANARGRRFTFCGTVPVLANGGSYPPPCPVKPGLSSTKSPEATPPRPLGPLRPMTVRCQVVKGKRVHSPSVTVSAAAQRPKQRNSVTLQNGLGDPDQSAEFK